MEEFLVLRESAGPALYGDNQFVAKVKDLPTGVFTAVLDMCFSGGAFKNLTLDAFGTVTFEPTLVKALPYPPEKDQQKERSFAIDAGPVAYKRFGCVKTERPSVLAKVFTPEGRTGAWSAQGPGAVGHHRGTAAGDERRAHLGLSRNGNRVGEQFRDTRPVGVHLRDAGGAEEPVHAALGDWRLQRDRRATAEPGVPPDAHAHGLVEPAQVGRAFVKMDDEHPEQRQAAKDVD